MTSLDSLWLAEAIRLQEQHTGPLEDSEAVRAARRQGGGLAERLQHRAVWLARQNGMALALQHWRQGTRLGLLGLCLLAVISGAGMAVAALGDGSRPVNVFWALGSLLGLNLLSLLAWCASNLVGQHGAALGRVWLWLGERLARDAQAIHVGPAYWSLLQRRRLGRWVLGSAAHGLWLLCGCSTLCTLLLMLATRRYGFVWETTVLASGTFVQLTQALGALPAALGFAVPDAGAIIASGDAALASARQPWASWLLGLLVCYGLLPRALLAALCWLGWRHGRRQLLAMPLTTTDEGLRERLLPSSEPLGVLDAERPTAHTAPAERPATYSQAARVVGIELDNHPLWPPTLPAHIENAGILDDRASRHRVLNHLAEQPTAHLLVACDPRRSPDRGTLALLGELSRSATATQVWLLPAANQDPLRLQAWHEALAQAGLAYTTTLPLAWLEAAHG